MKPLEFILWASRHASKLPAFESVLSDPNLAGQWANGFLDSFYAVVGKMSVEQANFATDLLATDLLAGELSHLSPICPESIKQAASKWTPSTAADQSQGEKTAKVEIEVMAMKGCEPDISLAINDRHCLSTGITGAKRLRDNLDIAIKQAESLAQVVGK